MGLLEKLKSVLGLDGSPQSTGRTEPDVTVEREPSAESERAVKGTGSTSTGGETAGGSAPRAPQSTSGASDATADPEAATDTVEESTSDHERDSAPEETAEASSDAQASPTPSATETVETAPDETDTDESTSTGDGVDVQEINGIGPTYADRLGKAGIETVADLADSEAATVADAAETSPSRAEDWIDQATDF